MQTPRYFAEIVVGGASQQTQFTALPTQIITQQSGQLDLALFDADNQPFAIDNLVSTDAKVVPFNTAEVPVTLGTGVVSFTGEVSNLTANGTSTPTGGTFTLTVDGETTSGIAFNADETVVLAALEALASRSPGDFSVLLTGGSNISDTGAVMRIELSGGFDIDARSTFDGALLTGDTVPVFEVTLNQSTIQNFYSVTWVKDTIPTSYSLFDSESRDGSISITVNLEETGTADRYKIYTRFNVLDGDLAGNQQTLPTTTFLLYYSPTYDYDNTITDADPGASNFRMNSTTLSSVSQFFLADDNKSSVDMSSFLQNLSIGASIYITNPNTQNEAALFTVSGTPVNATGYTKVPVTFVDAGTVSLVNGLSVAFNFMAGGVSDGSITNAKLADMAQSTIKGRESGAGTGVPVDLSKAQVLTILNVEDGADVTDEANVAATASVIANTAKVTNATHTGDATGSTALTVVKVQGNAVKSETPGAPEDGFVWTWVEANNQLELLVAPGAAGGQSNTASNVGGFTDLFKQKTGVDLEFKTLQSSGSTLDLTGNTSDVDIDIDLTNPNEYTGQQNFDEQTLSDGANISWNLNTQQTATVTLAGNRTLNNPTNLKAGATYLIRVVQDGTGSRTLAYGSAYDFPGGTAPVLTSGSGGAVDLLTFYCDGTNMLGVFTGDFK